MPEIPECLHRRYRALDELISELSTADQASHQQLYTDSHSHDPGIKLMCDFWNILKEDTDCNLSQAVKQRMGLDVQESGSMIPRQRVTCFMAGQDSSRGGSGHRKRDTGNKDAVNKIRDICSGSDSSNRSMRCRPTSEREKPASMDMPLTKALCHLQEAATLDKKCVVRVAELMETQKDLNAQIQNLEQREKEGVELLKEADCLWSCMETEYKKKIADSLERQKELLKQLKEVEKSNNKWRKNKKELEEQLKSVAKCRQEMIDKTMHKKNDLKVIEMEVTDFNKRIATSKRLSDGSKQVLTNKRTISDKKVANIAAEVTKIKASLADAIKHKKEKEEEGDKFVKEAREDLQKICKMLLQKKIENEDFLAEKEAILQEIELLKQTCDQCRDKCQTKKDTIEEEIRKTDQEIAEYRYQCIQCNQFTDTTDARHFCSDCPKCKEKRECLTAGDHCDRDTSYDCVCIGVKEKFLNNVFENMYTVLERHSKTKPGKVLANSIVKSLQNSRNGKLNAETRQQVHEFVLNTIKKNLNLTVVGGAVKTRCEMDADTYKQLMLCLKQVKVEKPPKEDKGTVAKKESCRHWGGSSECNCPGGAKNCVCSRRAPPPPDKPITCPPVLENEEEESTVLCPHKEAVGCGPDCSIRSNPMGGRDAAWSSTESCAASGCPFKKNMRAAQCVLGPESLNSLPKTYMTSTPYVPEQIGIPEKVRCRCSGTATPSECRHDAKQLKAGYCNKTNCTLADHSANDICKGYPLKHKYGTFYEPLSKPKKRIITSNISSQATALAETICDIECPFNQESSYKKTREIYSKIHVIDFSDKNKSQSDNSVSRGNFPTKSFYMNGKEKYIDLFDAKQSDDRNTITSSKSESEHSVHYASSKKRDILDFNEDNTSKIPKKIAHTSLALNHSNTALNYAKNKKQLYKTVDKKNQKPKDVQNNIKLELQKLYKSNKTTTINFKNDQGIYKLTKAPVTKTLSGNIAVDISIISNEVKLNYKELDVALIKSDSGTIIVDTFFDGLANAVIRKTPSGSCLLVMTDPVLWSRNTIKKNTQPAQKFYKVKIESDDYTATEPPAVLKKTSSKNYLVIPDKEYEIPYKETMENLLDDNSEYYVNLKRTESQNYVLQINNSWEEKEPNALVVKTSFGDIKILTKKNALISTNSGRKRISVTSSSKLLGGIIDNLPKTASRRSSSISKRSTPTKKSNSDSNIYEKIKLFYSDYKHLLAEPSAIIKMTNAGQYAVILDKESRTTFIKNLRSYLKNNFQGLVPIKKTDSGDITIALDGEQADKGHYGSLKITPSGNLYVIVDKHLLKDIVDEPIHNNSVNNSISDMSSKHIIGKVQRPVNKAVTTTCNAKPGLDCDISKCACADLKLQKLDWVLNPHETNKTINFFGAPVCGIDLRTVNDSSGIYNFSDDKSADSYSDSFTNGSFVAKALPHIIIKPCTCQPLLNNVNVNQQCFYVIEAVCPFDENLANLSESPVRKEIQNNSNWDSLTFLPPQLPEFLKEVKYKK